MNRARTYARRSAMQALYQWQMTGQDLVDIEAQFHQRQDLSKAEIEYFAELLHGVPRDLVAIDQALAEFVDRPVEVIDPVERAILRIGVYELLHRPDVPYRVVLNEGIKLAKLFGATSSHKYVNGILDKIARKKRPAEVAANGEGDAGKRRR